MSRPEAPSNRRLRPGLARALAASAFFLFLCTVAACSPGDGVGRVAGGNGAAGSASQPTIDVPGRDAEILWDQWGIPHIRAVDSGSLFYAFGWAQARNHGDLVLRNIGSARGRAAEYWGEDYLANDRWIRSIGIDRDAGAVYGDLDQETRDHVDDFAAGMSAYFQAHSEDVAGDVRSVLPIDGVDIMAEALAKADRFSGARNMANQWLRARTAGAETGGGAGDNAARAASTGSNGWAVSPLHSSSGNAMLLANPHLPWSANLTWMEAHLTAPGVDVYGATLVGLPTIAIGFNAALGWTHTVNTQDHTDIYELQVVDGDDGPAYAWDGGRRLFERRNAEIRIRTPDAVRTESMELLESVHGPVVARDGDRAVAVRRAGDVGADFGDAFRQWWDMARATDLAEFQQAIATNAIVSQNIVYADRDGNVAYFYGAATPRRSRGDVAFWRGVVPGDEPELVWTEVHPSADMPQVINPPSGWVQNANDPPWRSTWPPALQITDFPPYFGPNRLAFRPQRSIRMLRESEPLSLEELIERKHSTRMELADRIVPELVAAAREHGGEDARRAAEVLDTWDRTADADSRGGVLFAAWAEEALRSIGARGLFAMRWSPDEALTTPDGLADPAAAAAILDATARQVEADHGNLSVAWGDVFRLRRDNVDLPGNGGPGSLGIFRVTGYAEAEDGVPTAVGGDSFVATVEFGAPLRAFALIGYGNASRAGSPHRVDQLQLYAAKRLRPVLFSAAEIEAAVVEREIF